MREIGYGEGYVYAHDTEHGVAAMASLPQELGGRRFYRPGQRGFERELRARLAAIAARRRRSGAKDPARGESGAEDPADRGPDE
jgi:putative ATPase